MHASYWTHKGRYSNALQALTSTGVTGYHDDDAHQELLKHHPTSPYPDSNYCGQFYMVLSCLRGFPKGTILGASKLRAQHLLDAVSGSTACPMASCWRVFTFSHMLYESSFIW